VDDPGGIWVPTIGVDYFYTLSRKFDVGAIMDIEADKYLVEISEDDFIERNNVLLLAAVIKYKPYKGLGLFTGPGVEYEFHHDPTSFFVWKFGIEYELPVGNGWEITPSLVYDWKTEYSSYSYGFSIGKRF
jgi:hypothetical protein